MPYNVLENYDTGLGPQSFVDIYPAMSGAISNLSAYRQELYLQPSQLGTTPTLAQDFFWLLENTVTTPNKLNGAKIRGEGGFYASNTTGTAPQKLLLNAGFIGPITGLTRTTGVSISKPFFNFRGVGDELSGFYMRGRWDGSDGSTRPQTCIKISKGGGVGTGELFLRDLAIQSFQTGIQFGDFGVDQNCDTSHLDKVNFKGCDTAIATVETQVQQLTLTDVISDSNIIVDCYYGGMFKFNSQLMLTADQTGLYVRNPNKNAGSFDFYNIKLDNQAVGAQAVVVSTAHPGRQNTFNFWGGRDSRIITNGTHTDKIGTFYGNCTANIYGMVGVGDIVVGGTAAGYGGSINGRAAPYINLHGCVFVSRETMLDPRSLLIRTNGEPAREGIDYLGFSCSACTYQRPWNASSINLIGPGVDTNYNKLNRNLANINYGK